MSVEEYLQIYRISEEERSRIRRLGSLAANMDGIISSWYEWLKTLPEFDQFFTDAEILERVRALQKDYWVAFLEAEVDETYLSRRRRVGQAHATIGLPLNTYFAGMNMFLELLVELINNSALSEKEKASTIESVSKLLHLDTAIVVETYNQLIEETLTEQTRSLLEMSTPVTQIWEGILLLPIVGIIDSKRARDIMDGVLAKISETQSQIFIMDISGVGVVDTAVANHLIKITRATRLMGCETLVSGVSPAIAQTIVDLGIEVGKVKTTATMKDALSDALLRVGMEIVKGR
jgi:rsbT co-antagonist protein RsbR